MNKEELLLTLKKIGKGALISATGAAGLFILDAIGKLQINNAALAGLVVFAIPFLTNLIKSWMAGNNLAAKRKLGEANKI